MSAGNRVNRLCLRAAKSREHTDNKATGKTKRGSPTEKRQRVREEEGGREREREGGETEIGGRRQR